MVKISSTSETTAWKVFLELHFRLFHLADFAETCSSEISIHLYTYLPLIGTSSQTWNGLVCIESFLLFLVECNCNSRVICIVAGHWRISNANHRISATHIKSTFSHSLLFLYIFHVLYSGRKAIAETCFFSFLFFSFFCWIFTNPKKTIDDFWKL